MVITTHLEAIYKYIYTKSFFILNLHVDFYFLRAKNKTKDFQIATCVS